MRNIKDMKRSDWSRVVRKAYIAQDFVHDGIRGQMSLSVLRELTAPLTVRYPFGDVLIADVGYHWLQIALEGQYFWITAMYDREEKLINLYFDITGGNCFSDPENPSFRDMYLDIVAAGEHLLVLDQEELEEALENGEITQAEYDHAEKVCGELFAYLGENRDKVTKWCGKAHQELKAKLR